MQTKHKSNEQGFTLIEILVVIGIIAILAAVVLVAINPARQFAQANDSQRESNVNAILNAVGQYMADNAGELPGGSSEITNSAQEISEADADICGDLVPDYMPALPADPATGEPTECESGYKTGYNIVKSATTSRITVSAPSAELRTIKVTR